MKFILIIFFVFLAIYALLQRQRVRLLPWVLMTLSVVCIYFVLFPENATRIANLTGVGRGADLLLYVWFAIGSLVIFFMFVKIKKMHDDLTNLARAIAIKGAVRREGKVALGECKKQD